MPSRERVREFISPVERGEYVRPSRISITRTRPCRRTASRRAPGRQALVEHERKVLAGLKDMRTRRVETFLVDGDRVVINWVFEMTGQDGVTRVMDELALQTWDGDRIATERFYYDPAQIRPPRA